MCVYILLIQHAHRAKPILRFWDNFRLKSRPVWYLNVRLKHVWFLQQNLARHLIYGKDGKYVSQSVLASTRVRNRRSLALKGENFMPKLDLIQVQGWFPFSATSKKRRKPFLVQVKIWVRGKYFSSVVAFVSCSKRDPNSPLYATKMVNNGENCVFLPLIHNGNWKSWHTVYTTL